MRVGKIVPEFITSNYVECVHPHVVISTHEDQERRVVFIFRQEDFECVRVFLHYD